ncbi:MAG: tRNA (adenosine(37)-N6)-dimethylallyltransferase MiaA [Anaerolineales bacterium]|nr:tRNA (adenosine(37)-N6)-dimethylallyltransferase MiaA [Anaerolineales bacterium]
MPSAVDRDGRPWAAFIVGPTGSGKSALALALARRLPAEIVSADSRLLYRGFDIGTDKPSAVVRAEIPHHLIDVAEPDQPWSLAEYQAAALDCIRRIAGRGALPLCVGGTGQYVRALLEAWEIPPASPAPRLRRTLEQRSLREPAALYAELEQADPEAAARIDPRNVRRVVRALEVVLSTGRPFSAQRRRGAAEFQSVLIGLALPRPELYARVDARIASMIAAGWIEEVRILLAGGYSPALPAFSALGYGAIARHLQGELTREECVVEIRRATRRLVRHQANWFRPGDPNIHWLPSGPDAAGRAEAVLRASIPGLESA